MENAVKLALENYPSIKASQLSVEKEKAQKATAWDFGDTQIFTAGEEVGNDNSPTYTTIGFSQSDIDVFGIAPKSKLAESAIKLEETNVKLVQLEIERNVKQAWAKAYVSKKMYRSYSEIDSVFSDLNKAINLRYETEAISKLEHNATINQGKLIQLKKEQAFTTYQMALQELNQWLMDDFLYDVEEPALDEFDRSFLIANDSLKNHPLMKSWENQLEISIAQQKVSNTAFMPKFSAQYGFQKIGIQSGFNTYQFGLKIPLIFGKAKGLSNASKIQTQIIEQENIYKTAQLQTKFSVTMTQHEQLQKNWTYYKTEALSLAVEQREGATLAYKEGAMDYIAFLQTMKDAIQLEINTWKVLQDYLESKIQLEYFLTSNL